MSIELKPFPEVRVVKKLLNPQWAAQYRERAKPRKIELGAVLLTMSPKDREVAVYHEVGHWLRCEHLPRPKRKRDEEHFADAFVAYMLNPRSFRRADPDAHAEFETMLRGKRGKIRAFCKKALRFLNGHVAVMIRS